MIFETKTRTQTITKEQVIRAELEAILEPRFTVNSFGSRPNRSAHQTLDQCAKNCWDRVYHKVWLSTRNECYSRLHALRHKYPDRKFSFEELYNDICMERYLKRMRGM